MKKLTVLFIAALFVFGAAANSMAASYETFLSFYGFKNADGVNKSGVSEGKDFGDNEGIYNFGIPTTTGATSHFDIGDAWDGESWDTGIALSELSCDGVDGWEDIQVAVYNSFGTTDDYAAYGAYVSATGPVTVSDASKLGFNSAQNNIAAGVAPDAGQGAVIATDDANSYVSQMNTGEIGNLQGVVTTNNAEQNLAGLDMGGTVELGLYYAGFNSDDTYMDPVYKGAFTFSLDSDDSTLVADYNAVPVPAPLLLLGAGLLGLIGFRRKNA